MHLVPLFMKGIILPKTHIKRVNQAPLVFLAGPIKGAPIWQDEAIKILLSYPSHLMVASPRRSVSPEFQQYVVQGDNSYFPRQRAWERHYLDIASKQGAILFWLPGEIEHSCEKAYGAMTRVELGQWTTKLNLDRTLPICIGSDGKFSELDTIKYDLSLDAPEIELKNTLEETCFEATRLAFK